MGHLKKFASSKRAAMLSLAVLASANTTTRAQEVERTEWPQVPGATYYIGTMEEGGVTYKIITDSTWILTGKGTVKKIDAWGPRGPVRTRVDITSGPASAPVVPLAPETPPPLQEPQEEPASEPMDEPAIEDEVPPSPEEEDAPEAPSGDVEDTLPAEEQTEQDAAGETTTFTSRSRIGVSIGMGKQWMKSEVGISDFAGNANIGGTILSGMYGREGSSLWYEGEISAHNFTTETAKTDATTSSVQEERNTQTRARGMVFYNLFQQVSTSSAAMTGLSLGGGVQYLSHPMLVISNTQTGAATMQTKSGIALNMGARFATLFSLRNLLSTGLDLAPVNISGDAKSLSTNVFVEWLHLITPRVFTNVGITTSQEKVTHDDRCPSVTNCKSEGKTDSSVFQIRMGLALGI